MEVEGVAADDGDVVEGYVVRDVLLVEHLLACPLVNTASTGTASP